MYVDHWTGSHALTWRCAARMRSAWSGQSPSWPSLPLLTTPTSRSCSSHLHTQLTLHAARPSPQGQDLPADSSRRGTPACTARRWRWCCISRTARNTCSISRTEWRQPSGDSSTKQWSFFAPCLWTNKHCVPLISYRFLLLSDPIWSLR